MHPDRLVQNYLLLGLRFDRLVKGFVDAYTGDPTLRNQVAGEPKPEPAELAAQARQLNAALPDAGLSVPRARFLIAQLAALECSGRTLAGEAISFRDEVRAYFDVEIEPGDQDQYREAHRALAELLPPGPGPLAERLVMVRKRDEVPPSALAPAVHALSGALRDRARGQFELPIQESVDYEIVTDQPWSGFNYYLGGFRSRVAINADVGHRMAQLPHLVAHESYPGHHAEHCRKDAGLVLRDGQDEHTIFLVNTPQCLMAEGMADLGLAAIVGPGWGPWTAEILADLRLRMDGELAERIENAMSRLLPVRQDAALMLHDQGRPQDEVVDYLCRWLLIPEPRARQMLRFLAHPLWRAYTSTYVEGFRLLRKWLSNAPGPGPEWVRYRRLLDEPLVPGTVREELAGHGSGPAPAGHGSGPAAAGTRGTLGQ